MNAEQIKEQIQELETLAKEMLDAGNFNAEIFEQISQQIQEYQLQQKKLADEAKYLEEVDIQRIYEENGGKEKTYYASGIKGDAVGLEGYFNKFRDDKLKSQVVFVNQDNHWMTVRLEKVNGGMVYQVADSMPETTKAEQIAGIEAEINKVLEDSEMQERDKEQLIEILIKSVDDIKPSREERIDALLGGICTKIPFKSEKQQNGYDCGIHCALNAVDMKPNVFEEHKYFNAKATYSKYDVETIRENFEKEKVAPQVSVKVNKPQTIETLSLKLEKYLDHEEGITKTLIAIEKLNDLKSSHISITEPPLKMKPSTIQQQKVNNNLQDLIYSH